MPLWNIQKSKKNALGGAGYGGDWRPHFFIWKGETDEAFLEKAREEKIEKAFCSRAKQTSIINTKT